MSLIFFRLLIDFGLVVLIWIIQLIVYPSFQQYTAENLIIWHKKYTRLIGYIVGPLMLAQLGISIYQITCTVTFFHSMHLLVISLIWMQTFFQFVPLHTTISKGKINEQILLSLEHKNWYRTVLWTALFLYGFLKQLG